MRLNVGLQVSGVALLLSIGLVGCASTSANPDPAPSQSETYDPLAIPYNLVDSKQYKDLDVGDQMDIGKLNLMSVDEFKALPLETQFKFNSLQLDRYKPWALKVAKEANNPHKALPIDNPPTVTLQSSGQDIVDDSAIKRCVQWFSLAKQSQGSPGKLAEVGSMDRTTAAKMDSLRAAVGFWYFDEDQKQLQNNAAFGVSRLCAPDLVVSKESPLITLDGRKEKIVQGFNDESGHTIQQVYFYSELPDYKGEIRPNWILSDTGDSKASKAWYPDPESLK